MHPKTFFEATPIATQSGKCFVLMPFADQFAEIYETIREAVESPGLNFSCQRADDIHGAGHIMQSVLKGIGESEIILADLTGRNPNVFYELGIAHMAKEVDKVILLIQDVETIPFDLTPFRCIVYEQSFSGARKLKDDLIKAIHETAELLIVGRNGNAPIFQFKLRPGQTYRFPKKLFGESNCLYDFEIRGDYVGMDGAKFTLQMTQYIAGEPPASLPGAGYGMSTGQKTRLPKIPWEIKLEGFIGDAATFQLIHE